MPGADEEEHALGTDGEEVLNWIRGAREFWDGKRPEKLPFYVLYNVNTQEAFYSETQR